MENEQNEKMGRFISELRKAQNMTQKSLAEKLEVTDKAVSKWERGISCPDVSLLIPLSKVLGVTASELLNGEKTRESAEEMKEDIVEEAILYSKRNAVLKTGRIKKNILAVLSLAFMIAVVACVITDLCISKSLTWSLVVILSLAFSWILLFPFFRAKEKVIRKTFIVLSLEVIPFLVVLSWLLKMPDIWKMGSCISVVSLIGLWCVYAVFVKIKDRKFRAAGIAFLVAVPVTWGINTVIEFFTRESSAAPVNHLINIISVAVLAVICFGIDFFMYSSAE